MKKIKITIKWLKDNNACMDGIKMFNEIFEKSAELLDVINTGIKSKNNQKLQYCNWLITKKMNNKQRIKYAIFAAEQVLYIFEKKHPNDRRPRLAIEAAKKYLRTKTKSVSVASAAYADSAASAASANYDASASAASAASVAYAAYANYDASAAYAAYAAYAASVAYAASANYDASALLIKILKYGLKLLSGR